ELDAITMKENMLYFGQDLSNQYVRYKFEGEEAVLKKIAAGKLRGKIIRVGNLMSRSSDGEFQANAITSGFMRNLRGYATIGAYPVSEMARAVEFSPIDYAARAVCLLAKTPEQFTVFHGVNGHWIEMGDLVAAMNTAGISVEAVDDVEFQKRLTEALQDERKNMLVSGLISYLSSDADTVRSYVPEDHTFTKNVLYRLNYRWPLTDERYLNNVMESLITLGFFDGAMDN
ncbi:MAG: SDR family oxidoreductase, partial [Anaerovoracaceae bacterium]